MAIEAIFGYWFSPVNFGYHMREKRLVRYNVETTFNDRVHKFTYLRNFFGFRMNKDVNPSEISILFEGGSTGDQVGSPEEKTIVGNLNNYLELDNSDYFIGNASLNGKSTAGYINDFIYWFPRLENFNPKFALFYSGINDSMVSVPENKTFEDTYKYKIISYIFNNSIILHRIKKIKDKYIDSLSQKIIYDFNKKDLYKNFKFIDINEASNIYPNQPMTNEDTRLLNFYKQNLKVLKKLLEKQNITPIMITQTKFDGISTKMLYLINQETKKFAAKNNFAIIKIDELYKPDINDFYDPVHTTPKGSEKIAKIIYEKLKNDILNNAKYN